MPGILTLPMPLALSLLAAADRTAPDIAELPRGNGPAVRNWAAAQPGFQPGPAAGAPAPNKGAPAALPRISSRFGVRSDPFHRAARMHYGIDIPGHAGTPVRAAETGFVRFAGRAGSYGNLVEIAHGGGIATRYAHLARVLVPAGAQVTRGDVIALMGSTGRSTGSHLHFELRADGRAVDPLPHLGGAALPRAAAVIAPAAPHRSAFARARDASLPEDRGPEL
ncbi:M23 family metallopeptidase [Sphingomonas sp. BT-65]|uniref:M23 family metallopeptidase n=1 Tax=Sphingomonas sp. BT-65 TaxID=2989821 RepID=UPI0022363C64|nr:M23 family metallopeptidase [Sphingomonas sp. BT-65]MCW4461040.1 M23 family metallopeptidase [Sphingomonas sp. BT-65]